MEIKPFQFLANPRLVFGTGKIKDLQNILGELGSHFLFVTGSRSFRATEKWEKLVSGLKSAGMDYYEYQVSGEPSPEMIDYAVEEFRERSVHAVISIGGGSVIDAGKAISAMLPQKGSVADYLEDIGNKKHDGVKAPFIAVPTTAGTGSEATKNAVISRIGKDGFKKSLRHNNLVPDIALVDPELTLTCPPEISAASGLDAFTQLLESYVSPNANPMTDALALDGMNFIQGSLLKVCLENPGDLDSRSGMSYGAYLSGLTLTNAGLGAVHGLASVIGGMFEIPHGVICGTLLAEITAVNIRELKMKGNSLAANKYASVGRLLAKSNVTTEEAYRSLMEVLTLWTDQLQLPKLGEFGVRNEDIRRIAEAADIKNNPVKLDPKILEEILLKRL